MKEFDISGWRRREIYEAFSELDFPFYHAAFYVDVTRLKAYTSKRHLSFYYSMIWLATKAADSILNFRLRIESGKIYDIESSAPGLTFLKPGSENFQIVICSLTDRLDDYSDKVRKLTENQLSFKGGENIPENGQIYFSCLPWMEITSLSSERAIDPDNSIPRIAWGKYVERDGKLQLCVSVDVNHRLIDGYHIGRFYQELQSRIDTLPA